MTATSTYGLVSLEHLSRLSDHQGLFEHAEGTVPRVEHGYCVDDNARMLIVASREPDVRAAHRLGRLALGFVLAGLDSSGRSRNRMNVAGRWTDEAGTDDCWGRSIWGLGVAASSHHDRTVRSRALAGFDSAVRQRSPHLRAMMFAALGAADVLTAHPGHRAARSLLVDALARTGPDVSARWRWPEARLTYANATIAEAVIAAGVALDDPAAVERGLALLAWLLQLETRDGHLSVSGVGGRTIDDPGPQFDQQSIEPAAMADACWRAYCATGDPLWIRGIRLAAAWFSGDNDSGSVMYDDRSGGGYDGLQQVGVNLNQGAESTIALISTMQRARVFTFPR